MPDRFGAGRHTGHTIAIFKHPVDGVQHGLRRAERNIERYTRHGLADKRGCALETVAHLLEFLRCRTLEAIDRLFFVAHGEQRADRVTPCAVGKKLRRECADHRPLHGAGVLRLIDENVVQPTIKLVEHPLCRVRLARRADLGQQVGSFLDQVVEVERGAAIFLGLVGIHHRIGKGDEGSGGFKRDQLLALLQQSRKRITGAGECVRQRRFGCPHILGDELVRSRFVVLRQQRQAQRRGAVTIGFGGACVLAGLGQLLIGGLATVKSRSDAGQGRVIEDVRHCVFGAGGIEISGQLEHPAIEVLDRIGIGICIKPHQLQQPASLPECVAQNIVETVVGGKCDGHLQRSCKLACGVAHRGHQRLINRCPQQSGGRRFIQDFEMRRDAGFQRKALQQPFAKAVDGLHLEPARRLDGGGEQLPRARCLSGIGRAAEDFCQQS